MRVIFLVFSISIFISGCAVGVEHRYDLTDAQLNVDTKQSVAVGVLDQRPYVVNGEKGANFVGIQRGGFGNPFDVTTVSGNPLAEDMSATIETSLKANQVAVQRVAILPEGNSRKAISTLGTAKASRSLLITLREWKSDTYTNTKLTYDIHAQIFSTGGEELARKVMNGQDNLGGDFVNPPGHARIAVPKAFRQKLKDLFSDSQIKAALR